MNKKGALRITLYVNPARSEMDRVIYPYVKEWVDNPVRGVKQEHMIVAIYMYIRDVLEADVSPLGDLLLQGEAVDRQSQLIIQSVLAGIMAGLSDMPMIALPGKGKRTPRYNNEEETAEYDPNLVALLSESVDQVYDEEGSDNDW